MAKLPKLTTSQRRELLDMAENSPLSYAENYKPILRLTELGYAESRDGSFGSKWYYLTEAGKERAALEVSNG